MDTVFDYEDIQLIPAKCIVNSRSECDTSVTLGGRTFRLPVVPANMQTIIDEKIAFYLAQNGYFYIMHRFEPEKRISFIKDMISSWIIRFYQCWCKTRRIRFHSTSSRGRPLS